MHNAGFGLEDEVKHEGQVAEQLEEGLRCMCRAGVW